MNQEQESSGHDVKTEPLNEEALLTLTSSLDGLHEQTRNDTLLSGLLCIHVIGPPIGNFPPNRTYLMKIFSPAFSLCAIIMVAYAQIILITENILEQTSWEFQNNSAKNNNKNKKHLDANHLFQEVDTGGSRNSQDSPVRR